MKKLDHFAFITGASGGLGKDMAIKLAESGYGIIAHYNSNESKANELKGIVLALEDRQEIGIFRVLEK